MSKNLVSNFPDLRAMANAARAVGEDIAKTKDELERLVQMIVKDTIIEKTIIVDPETKEKREETKERTATVEDMITSTLVLVLQDEKFRKHVPDKMLQQLMLASAAVRGYERRELDVILPAVKGRVRSDLLTILHRAYPAWQSLVPDATNNMLQAMTDERQKQQENKPENAYLSLFGKRP